MTTFTYTCSELHDRANKLEQEAHKHGQSHLAKKLHRQVAALRAQADNRQCV